MFGFGTDRHEKELAEALSTSLDVVRGGTGSLADCLQRHPDLAAELEPLLRTALRVDVLRRVSPTEDARLQARYTFLAAAATQSRPVQLSPRPAVRKRAWLAFMPAAAAALIFALIAVPVIGSVDSGAVPGDWNYGFKRATERVRLAFTVDSDDRRVLRLEFARRRLDEIERLSSKGQVDAHATEVAALIRDYTSDVQQVQSALTSGAALPDSARQQLDAVNTQAQSVLAPIAQSASADVPSSVSAQAADAVATTQRTVAVAGTIPPPRSTTARVPQQAPSPTTAAVQDTATPAPTVSSTPVSSPSPVPIASATPAPTATTTSTAQPGSTSTAPAATPTRTSQPLQVQVNTPLPSSTAEVAIVPRTATPVTPPSPDGSATAVPAATSAPAPAIAAAAPATSSSTGAAVRSPSPAPAVAPVSHQADTVPATASAPLRTPTAAPAVPTPVATRPSTALAAGPLSIPLSAGDNTFRYIGEPSTLDAIVSSIVAGVVVVYYPGAGGQTSAWYPGTPAPAIATGTVLTVRMRTAMVLVISH